jgi:hypothetical protein
MYQDCKTAHIAVMVQSTEKEKKQNPPPSISKDRAFRKGY